MDKKLICENKFEYGKQTIMLPVELNNLPNKLLVQGNDFVLKSSFHVSLVCIGEIIKKYNILIQDFENKIINDFCEFTRDNNVSLESYLNDFKLATENDKKSVIVMCKISNLDKFFEFINKKYELEIEHPPTHVTLYTLESRNGIFLTNKDDIKNLTVPIDNPIGYLL